MDQSVTTLLQLYSSLSPEEQNCFLQQISTGEQANLVQSIVELPAVTECPHCKSQRIRRFGFKGSKQRYQCKDCGKTFLQTTGTIFAGSLYPLSVWRNYIDCMMKGLSIRKSAAVCGIDPTTAFYWRHKILDALQLRQQKVEIGGVIEADETFMPLSFKGNHKSFKLPRPARHRGAQVHKRGLSKEQVCIPCAVNREGLSFSRISNLGTVSADALNKVFAQHLKADSVLVTDRNSSYIRYSAQHELRLIQVKNCHSKGLFNIQRINSYHSLFKRFIRPFNGVSTKYLNNYFVWHNFLNIAKDAIDIVWIFD